MAENNSHSPPPKSPLLPPDDRTEETLDRHEKHVTRHFIDCDQCHERIEHGQVEMVSSLRDTCDTCHGGLHSAQREVYMGASGRGVSDTPSRMFAAQVSCRGCHVDGDVNVKIGVAPAESLQTRRELCVKCHGPGYDEMLDDWKRVTDQALLAVQPAVDSARARLATRKESDSAEARQLLDDAVHNYDLVVTGKAAHNVEYAVKLLNATISQVETANKMLGGGLTTVSPDAVLGAGANTCTVLCHDRIGLPENLVLSDLDTAFPHQLHYGTLGLGCATCHPANKHKQGSYSKTGCVGCHHMSATTTEKCGTCHAVPEKVYLGTAEGFGVAEVSPDPMVKVVNCLGCHDLESADPQSTVVRARCTMCHGETYGATFDGWKTEHEAAITSLGKRLDMADDMLSLRGGSDPAAARKLVLEAKANYELVKRSGYAHNPVYAKALLAAANGMLDKVHAELAPKGAQH